MGGKTLKIKFGHRGGEPAGKKIWDTGKVEITSQNHGFAVDLKPAWTKKAAILTHINLNEDSLEGLKDG